MDVYIKRLVACSLPNKNKKHTRKHLKNCRREFSSSARSMGPRAFTFAAVISIWANFSNKKSQSKKPVASFTKSQQSGRSLSLKKTYRTCNILCNRLLMDTITRRHSNIYRLLGNSLRMSLDLIICSRPRPTWRTPSFVSNLASLDNALMT